MHGTCMHTTLLCIMIILHYSQQPPILLRLSCDASVCRGSVHRVQVSFSVCSLQCFFVCATCAVTVSEFPSPVWLDHSPVSVATLTGKSSRWTRCTCRWTASSRASAASGWHWAPAKTAMRSAGNVKRQYSADTSQIALQWLKSNARRASIRKRHGLAGRIFPRCSRRQVH